MQSSQQRPNLKLSKFDYVHQLAASHAQIPVYFKAHGRMKHMRAPTEGLFK